MANGFGVQTGPRRCSQTGLMILMSLSLTVLTLMWVRSTPHFVLLVFIL